MYLLGMEFLDQELSIVIFIQDREAVFQSGDTNLHIHQPCIRISVAPWLVWLNRLSASLRTKGLLVITFATAWMDLENIMLSEISQMVRDKYHMISPLTGT